MKNFWAVGEISNSEVTSATPEVFGFVDKVSDDLLAETDLVITGSNILSLCHGFTKFGQALTIMIESDEFESGDAGLIAREIADLAISKKPYLIALPLSPWGQEVAARVAGRLRWPLVTDAIGIETIEDKVVVERMAFGGQSSTKVALPQGSVITVHPHAGKMATPVDITTTLERIEAATSSSDVRKVVEKIIECASEGPSLADSQIIVSGGRGMGNPENFELVKQLAKAMGCAFGASRAVVDAGWVDPSHQVGLTGKVVSPKLYIACGISGADQHLAGMRTSDVIVAINRDPDAPIFKLATYGIVGDCLEIIPALIETLKYK